MSPISPASEVTKISRNGIGCAIIDEIFYFFCEWTLSVDEHFGGLADETAGLFTRNSAGFQSKLPEFWVKPR